jgi:transposase-like protein
MAKKTAKKGAYGKRYSDSEKAAIIARWHKEQARPDRGTQMQFCKDVGITVVTLNQWRERFSADKSAAAAPAQPAPSPEALPEAAPAARAIISLDAPQAVAVIDGSVADIVEQIRQQQQTLAELRAKLHAWVDTL